MKRRSSAAGLFLLLPLLLLCAALLWLRAENRPFGLTERTQLPAAPEATAEALPARTPEPTPEAFPEPTAAPVPTPTPEPTPRPLSGPELTGFGIDRSFFEPSSEPGTLLKDVVYTTRDYVDGHEGPYTKRMQVYLPWGYREEERYDVLFLLHVRQLDERFWLEQSHDYWLPDEGDVPVSAAVMLDNLIERGCCRPLIVIALNGYLTEEAAALHRSDQVYPQFEKEFANDILPFVAQHFSTWAEGGSREQLQAARRHFGVLGASFGAYQAELSVLAPNLDLVSWFCLTGGGSVTRDYLEPWWSVYGTLDEPIDLLYFVEGECDDLGPVQSSYQALAGWTEKFTDNENLRFTLLFSTWHDWREWIDALYNSAQLFFRTG